MRAEPPPRRKFAAARLHEHSHTVQRMERVEPGRIPDGQKQMKLSSSWLNWSLRLILGGAFVLAGTLKIADPAKFAIDLGNYRLLPHETIHLVASLLPWIEVVTGFFVLTGVWLR